MKRMIFGAVALAAVVLAGCEKATMDDALDDGVRKDVTFNVGGDFATPTISKAPAQVMRRAPIATSDGVQMQDLWVLDYMGGTLKQTIHQEAADEDFGSPTLSLALGEHDLYFVCAGGEGATVTEAQHKITWTKPSDTFWKHLALSVTTNTAASQGVTLDRVATRLSIKMSDAIPENVAHITVQPATWYCGVDWLTGNGTDAKVYASDFDVTSYAGRTNIKLMTYGMAQDSEFATDVTVTAYDSEDNKVAGVSITGSPQQKNRSTMYTGRLFSSNNGFSVTLNDTWGTSHQNTW